MILLSKHSGVPVSELVAMTRRDRAIWHEATLLAMRLSHPDPK